VRIIGIEGIPEVHASDDLPALIIAAARAHDLAIEAGDVLVAYTDGVSEAMNARDEEWGEERLMNAVAAHRMAPARALIDCLMTSADAFVAGAPQHDDMTLIVVRMI